MVWISYKKTIDCLKMYKVFGKVITFITEAMKNWKVELTARWKTLAEVKIQRGIFHGDELSSLLFVIVMMSLNHMLRKFTGSNKLPKSQEKINHRMYMNDIKLFAKNEKKMETLVQTIRICNLCVGIGFVKEKRAMLIMMSGKRELT